MGERGGEERVERGELGAERGEDDMSSCSIFVNLDM